MHQRIFSDSAFKKEESSGHCMRGSVYLLCEGQGAEAYQKKQRSHICWTLLLSNSEEWYGQHVRPNYSAAMTPWIAGSYWLNYFTRSILATVQSLAHAIDANMEAITYQLYCVWMP